MLKYKNILLLILPSYFLFSCSQENKDISTYIVSNKNFENILEIEGYVEPVQSTTLTCPRHVDGIVTFLVEDGTYVNEGDVVCVIEFQELQNEYDQILTNLEETKAELNKIKADLYMQYALLEAQVKNNDAETKIAQLDSLQLQYLTPSQKRIKELELEKVAIEKFKYEKKLEALSIINQSEIKKMEINIQHLSNRVQSTKERLDELTLKAPKKGLATRAIYRITNKKLQVGDPVWGNMPLIIIPELEEVKINIWAPEKDYKYINVDDSVYYYFDAMPGNMAWGKILKKAPVGQPQKEGSKVKLFEIEASVDSMLSLPEPGFTANCHVILKQIKDTIVIPQIAIFEEDSMKVVYVKKDKSYEMRQILTGLSSPKEAIIGTGLKRKEEVALSKPETSLIKEKTILPDSIAKQSNKEQSL